MSRLSIPTAGIDTAKDKLDVAEHGLAGGISVANSLSGWKRLVTYCAEHGVQRVGIEATGGYERGVRRHLQAQGLKVILLQPLQVKAFAQLHLRRAKSDRLDAALIAACTLLLDASQPDAADPR